MHKIQLMRILVLLMLSSAGTCGQDNVHTIVFPNKKADAEMVQKEQLNKIIEGHRIAMNELI